MKLSGPCFNTTNEKITCIFYDTNGKRVTVNGIITINDKGNEKAICPMPLFTTLGSHNVTINLNDGTSYTGSFTVGK